MDEPAHVPLDTATAVPAKSILKKKCSYECDSHHTHTNSITLLDSDLHRHDDHHHHHDDNDHNHFDSSCPSHCSHSKSASQSEDPDAAAHRRAQWDEMNILATYHPANKDYGHMKIDDPPTPYHEYTQQMVDEDESNEKMDATDSNSATGLRERKASFSDTTTEMLDADTLAQKLNDPNLKEGHAKACRAVSSDSDDESNMTEEEIAEKKAFKLKRKQHYNEFEAMKLARQLLQEEEDNEDEVQ